MIKLVLMGLAGAVFVFGIFYVEWVVIPNHCKYIDSLDKNPNTGRPLDLDIYDCGPVFGEQTVAR